MRLFCFIIYCVIGIHFELLPQMTRMFGMGEDFGDDAILGRLEGMKDVIEQVNKQFKDPVRITLNLCMVLF